MAEKSTTVRIIQRVAPVVSSMAPGLSSRVLARMFITPMRIKPPSREVAWLQEATMSRARLPSGRTIAVYRWSVDSADRSRPRILLAHGWSGRGTQLGAFVAPLLAAGFDVVSFDQVGHGGSDGRLSSLPEFADVALHVGSAFGPFHAAVGHSLGCAALSLAMNRGLELQRVVYIAGPADPPMFLGRLASSLGFSPTVVARAKSRLERRFGVPFERAHAKVLAPSMTADLLAIHDDGDADVPVEEAHLLANLWPRAYVVVTSGLGHHRIVRDPDVVRRTVAFVASGKLLRDSPHGAETSHTEPASRQLADDGRDRLRAAGERIG